MRASRKTLLFCVMLGVASKGYTALEFKQHVITDDSDHLVGCSSWSAVDMDKDGDVDFLASSNQDNKIAWFENLGNFEYQIHTISTNVKWAIDAVGIDFDQDGDTDVVAASMQEEKICWFKNDGRQRFTEYVISRDVTQAQAIDVVDLDSDGDLDVLSVSMQDDCVYWHQNFGGESFSTRVLADGVDGAKDVLAADVDGDGDMDFFALSSYERKLYLYVNNGREIFDRKTISHNQPLFMALSDLDSDGDTDVLTRSQDKMWWLENDGVLGFTTHEIPSDVFSLTLCPGDVDSDGDTDIVLFTENENEIAWLKNDGDQSFSNEVIGIDQSEGFYPRLCADIDFDGDVDLMAAFTVVENKGGGVFTKHGMFTGLNQPSASCAYDLDSDGDMDLVVGSGSGRTRLNWFENMGDDTFEIHWIDMTFRYSIAKVKDIYVADLDSDGDPDIVAGLDWGDYVLVFENDGNQNFTMKSVGSQTLTVHSLDCSDVDQDGDLDIVTGHYYYGARWLENLGGLHFIQHTLETKIDLTVYSVQAVDFDKDGDVDIVSATYGALRLFENDGYQHFTLIELASYGGIFMGYRDIEVVDFDQDGDWDILAAEEGSRNITWYENAESGELTRHTLAEGVVTPNCVQAADLDRDSDLDLIYADTYDDQLVWCENSGNQVFVQQLIQDNLDYPQFFTIADFDSDGDFDVFAGSGEYTYAWYENAKVIYNPGSTYLQAFVNVDNLGKAYLENELLISWSWNGDVGEHIRIDLHQDSTFVRNIRLRDSIWGNYTWTVPPTLSTGSGYQIRIESVEKPGLVAWSDPFIIDSSAVSKGYASYTAGRIDTSQIPVMDGVPDELFWQFVAEDSLLRGGVANSFDSVWTDFADCLVTWKAVWCNETNRLYVALQVRDDVRGQMDNGSTGSDYLPSMDESIEFCTDGNSDGGEYWNTFGPAQYWRVTEANERDLLHYPTSDLYPSLYTGDAFQTAVAQGENGDWTCEAVFTIYNTYPDEVRNLSTDDMIGWDIWVNDSDNESQTDGYYGIDHQIGWNYKGKVWRFADFCGQLKLGNTVELPQIQVVSPDTAYYREDLLIVSWQSQNAEDMPVRIELTDGINSVSIADSTDNDGLFEWTVDGLPENIPYFIQITLLAYPEISGISASAFRMLPESHLAEAKTPMCMALLPGYPNPFNPETTIPYTVSHAGHVQICVYNILGKMVRTLLDVDQSAGQYELRWDGRDQAGQHVSSGIFIVQMQAGSYMKRQKVMLLK